MAVRAGSDCTQRTETTIFLKEEVVTPGTPGILVNTSTRDLLMVSGQHISSLISTYASQKTPYPMRHLLLFFLLFLSCPQHSLKDNFSWWKKKLFEYITCQTSPSQWTFPGHLIYNCNLFSTNIPLSRSLIYFLCNTCHHSHIMYFNYWPISPNRKQTSWGQGFIFFAHYCISLVLEQCLCLLVIQWIFEECWCRWQMKAPSSLTSYTQHPGESQS